MAIIVGAQVAVIAVDLFAAQTGSGQTGFSRGTRVAVVAWQGVVFVGAADCGVAPVGGAKVAVIAVQEYRSRAPAIKALVSFGAWILVVAGGVIWRMSTKAGLIARVVGAWIAVVTVNRWPGDAFPVSTLIVHGAGVAVIAGNGVVLVGTPSVRLTEVVGAWIAVTTIELPRSGASTVLALVIRGAGVAVVARGRVRSVNATRGWFAGIIGAGVGIATGQGCSRGTIAICAHIAHGTGVTVIAGSLVVFVLASRVRVAEIGSAWVVVFAIDRHSCQTGTVSARRPNGASVAIIARPAIVGLDQPALPGDGVAGSCEALGTKSLRFGASNNRFRGYGTLLRELVSIAKERAVAYIAVFQEHAVEVLLALARDRKPLAVSLCA